MKKEPGPHGTGHVAATLPARYFRQLEFWLLGLLFAINFISIFGFVVFALNPATLALFPWAPAIFAVSYMVFSQAQIVTAFLAMAVALTRYTGMRWLPALVLLTSISAASELLGTMYGVPFGPYSYTNLLGPKLLGHVPYLIPLSWFFMAVPSYWMAHRVFAAYRFSHTLARIVLASLLLLSWDLTLDPAMSFLTPFWVWGEAGYYYGMPFSNLVGWLVTGLALMTALEAVRAASWLSKVPGLFLSLFYIANVFLPFFMAVFGGLFGAVVVTTVVATLYVLLLYLRGDSSRSFFLSARDLSRA